jgi:hypothetical protein
MGKMRNFFLKKLSVPKYFFYFLRLTSTKNFEVWIMVRVIMGHGGTLRPFFELFKNFN